MNVNPKGYLVSGGVGFANQYHLYICNNNTNSNPGLKESRSLESSIFSSGSQVLNLQIKCVIEIKTDHRT